MNLQKNCCFIILDLLVDNLRCKNIWVEGAYKYSDPNKNLPEDFKRNQSFYYDMLSLTRDKDVAVQNIKRKMVSSIRAFNLSITSDEEVKIGIKKGKPHIKHQPTEGSKILNELCSPSLNYVSMY